MINQVIHDKNAKIYWLELSSLSLETDIERILIDRLKPQLNGKSNGVSKRVTVDLPKNIHRRFKILAAELETDMNTLLLEEIDKFLDSRDRYLY